MAWDNEPGNNQNPWGKNGGGPRRGRGQGEADLDEIIRKAQERLRRLIPGSGGGSSIMFILAGLVLIWGLSGFYRVQAD